MKKTGKAINRRVFALGVREASGLEAIGNDTFLVVDDEHGIFRCVAGTPPQQLDAGKGLGDLEGIAVDADGSHAYTVSEHDGSIRRFSLTDDHLDCGERLGQLPRLSKNKNRGWEGVALTTVDGDAAQLQLVAVHQAKPRRIGLFDAATLQQRALFRLPKKVRKTIGELSDVAVDQNGRVLLLSGKSGHIVEMQLRGKALLLVHIYRCATSSDDVPEGICIDSAGRIWICTDGKGELRELELTG
jgi:uncharacterized protein YjiK